METESKAKKTFFNSYPPASVTPSGSPIVPVFIWNEKHTALVKTGERDLQKEIDAAAVGLTPYEIIDRMVRTGDDSLLAQGGEGQYGDFTGLPETISDAKKILSAGEDAAEALSQEQSSNDSAAKPAAGNASATEQDKPASTGEVKKDA